MSYVYVIASETPPACKIGFSSDPMRRLLALQTKEKGELSLILSMPVDHDSRAAIERGAQLLLIEKSLGGEWFDVAPPEAVAAVAAAVGYDYTEKPPRSLPFLTNNRNCIYCGSAIKRKNNKKFCDTKCHSAFANGRSKAEYLHAMSSVESYPVAPCEGEATA